MNRQEVLKIAKTTGVLISGQAGFHEAVQKFGRSLIKRAKPLTPTQLVYLEALDEWKSLHDLAEQFGCTSQNALKMVRALEHRNLISKQSLFKRRLGRGAWAFYYRKKG